MTPLVITYNILITKKINTDRYLYVVEKLN